MTLSRLSKLATLGAFYLLIAVSESSKTSLRSNSKAPPPEPEAMEIVTMEMIDEMIALEDFEEAMQGGEGGLRKLDDTCWHGGQTNQNLYWLGRYWGNCQSMSKCVCGLQPRRMAYWCPALCRPSCGGSCATPSSCPRGFNIENGNLVSYTGTPDPYSYPTFCMS